MKMSFRWGFAVIVLLAWLLSPPSAFAFRCGSNLISEGDHQPRVLRLCGDPSFVETWQEERVFRYYYTPDTDQKRHTRAPQPEREPLLVKEFVTIDRWTYNLGTYRLVRYLTFENGVLVEISAGEHGY